RFLPGPGQAALRSLPWGEKRGNVGHFLSSVMRSPSNRHWLSTIRTYLGGIPESAIIVETAITKECTTLEYFLNHPMRTLSLNRGATIRTYLGGIAETAIIEETAMTIGFTTLDELLNDPMVQLVMKRDGVRPEQLRSMLERVEARPKEAVPPAHVIDSRCRAE